MTSSPIDEDDAAPVSAPRTPLMRSIATALPCDACGYDRRGLPTDHPCPECGYLPDAVDRKVGDYRKSHVRVMSAGLVLLLCCSLPAISVILYSPFRGDIGGTLPALNFPGPKLWAMPLLQRAIGNQPAEAGVNGTRTAMLSLFAIWLITIAPRDREIDVAPKLRLATRWVATITFGLGAGLLLASGGIWPSERLPYWLVLGGGIELPAAALLYAYLARVGRSMLPSRSLHATINMLVWIAPLLIAGCVSVFIIDPTSAEYVSLNHRKAPFTLTEHRVLSGVIGVMLVTAGVIATAAVMRLAVGLAGIGFPRVSRIWTLADLAVRNGSRTIRRIEPSRARAAIVATGLLIWIIATLCCIDATGNMSARKGVAGNIPFFNYLGPKAHAIAIVHGFGDRWTTWYALPGVHAVLLNLLAIALISTPLNERPTTRRERRTQRIAALARWWPVLAAGCIFGVCQGWPASTPNSVSYFGTNSGSRSELAAFAIAICELPATVLIYVLLIRLSDTLGLDRVASRLRLVTIVMVGLMLMALASFVASRWFLQDRQSMAMLAGGALYGAVSAGVGLLAIMSIVPIALKLVRDRVLGEISPPPVLDSRLTCDACLPSS